MTWQCRRCGRTVDLVLRDGDRCAACAMRTRAGRRLPADDGAADPPVDGWDVIRRRKLLLQPSSVFGWRCRRAGCYRGSHPRGGR